VDIREVDVHDDAQFHDFYAVTLDALRYGRPDAPMWSEREARVGFRTPDPSEDIHAFAAYHGDDLVGVAEYFLPLLDNTDKAYFEVHVAPENRRRGIGGALVDHVVDMAAAAGRTVLLSQCNLPLNDRDDHPYAHFARKHGFALASVEVRRDLPLPVSEEQLSVWQLEAAPYHSDYRLETYVDDLPDELLESFCALTNQLAVDAPTGDIDFEAEGMTPETLRIQEQKAKAQGRTVFETLALDHAGAVVAQTTLAVPSDDPTTIHQWGTMVRKQNRGHRLGLAVKARNLAAVQRAFPDRRRVVTSNSELNDHMLAINVKMGFEPVELFAELQRKL
jgi:GNAT superfamily N-acetyltransferase